MSTTTASQTIHLPSGAIVTIRPTVVVQETPIREWDVQQLYDELEHWINVRARWTQRPGVPRPQCSTARDRTHQARTQTATPAGRSLALRGDDR